MLLVKKRKVISWWHLDAAYPGLLMRHGILWRGHPAQWQSSTCTEVNTFCLMAQTPCDEPYYISAALEQWPNLAKLRLNHKQHTSDSLWTKNNLIYLSESQGEVMKNDNPTWSLPFSHVYTTNMGLLYNSESCTERNNIHSRGQGCFSPTGLVAIFIVLLVYLMAIS